MKNQFKFTKAFVKSVATEKLRERFYDTVVDGLVLTVTNTGSKSYYVKFWRSDVDGKGTPVERVIGQEKNITLDLARRKAVKLKVEFADSDPRKKYRDRDVSLEDLHQVWLKDIEHEVRVGKASALYVFNKRRCWEIHMPKGLARGRADALKLTDFIELFQEIKEESESVHIKLAKHCKSLYKIARERLELDLGNPLVRYKVGKDSIRERFLTVEEMPIFMEAVSVEKQIYQDAIMSLLLTGQRKKAVLSMAWADLDLVGSKNWRIPKSMMKGRAGGHTVPLAGVLVEILLKRKMQKADGELYVFPSPAKEGNHITGNGGAGSWWTRVRNRSGLTDITLHDLRRTLGSWLAIDGVDIYKISKVLAHKDVRVTQEVYAHLKAVDARVDIDRVVGQMMSEKKDAAESSDSLETLAANLSGEDKMKMISLLSRSMI